MPADLSDEELARKTADRFFSDSYSSRHFSEPSYKRLLHGILESLAHRKGPPYEIADVEDGQFYVVRRGTDHVVTQFTDPPPLPSEGGGK